MRFARWIMKTNLSNGTIINSASKAIALSIVATVSLYSGSALGGSEEQGLPSIFKSDTEAVALLAPVSTPTPSPNPTPTPIPIPGMPEEPNKPVGSSGAFLQQVREQDEGLEVLLSDFRLTQASSSSGGENSSSSKMDGDDADKHFMDQVQSAIRRHPSVHSGALSELQAIQGVNVAESYLYPQVTGGLEGGYSLRNRPGRVASKGFSPTAVLTVNQLLFDAGQTHDRISAAQSLANADHSNSMTKAQDFALRAVSTYMDVTRLETQVLMAQDNLARHELLLDRVQQRTDGGVGGRADVLRARGRLADARAQLIAAMGEFEQIHAAYQELFGVQPSHVALPTVHPQLGNAPNDLVSQALQSNFSINRAHAQSEAAQFESDAELAGRYPKLSLVMEGRQYEANRINNQDNEVTALLNFTYPFYTGGRLQAERERASIKLSQMKADEQALRLEVERQVRFSITDISSRTEQLASLELAVEADRQTFDNYLELFTVGRRSYIDLLDAQRDLFANSVALVNSRVQLDLSKFILSQKTGSLLEFFSVKEIPDHG